MPMRDLTVVAAEGTWVVRAEGAVIGESTRAMEMVQDGDVRVIYFPRDDLGMAFLEELEGAENLGGLGDARFFDVLTSSDAIPRAAWSYTAPPEGAERIAGMIAFDDSRVAIEPL